MSTDDINIRPAQFGDVEAVRDLFVAAYGQAYPFKQFYDVAWLRHAVYDDATVFLVAEGTEGILGTISAMLSAGDLSDLIGEFGRLVVHPAARGRDVGTRLFQAAAEHVARGIHFGFAEARTAHAGSQKILERIGFAPIGFQPLKYALGARESMAMYGRLFGAAREQRRNHPRLIAEAAPLAMAALSGLELPADVIVVDDEAGFPGTVSEDERPSRRVEIEDLSEQGWSPLLRIERGRVRGRDLYGNLSLAHGFFKIRTDATRYLVAREGGNIVGGLGLTHDPVDRKVRFFELIGLDDEIKGRLLGQAERLARETLQAAYVEADVSAYAPAIQRTLERMGFMAVVYGPSMVFENVERLDVVRMAKLIIPYFHEDIPLTAAADGMRELVERAMADRRDGAAVAVAAGASALFRGLLEGDMYHLARLGRLLALEPGARLLRRGDAGDRVFIVVSGSMRAEADGAELGRVAPGETVGEMALLDAGPRSADVVAVERTTLVEFRRDELMTLMDQRPRIGAAVMRNFAALLAARLRRAQS